MNGGLFMELHTILLVDDDPDIRRIGELSLARVGGWQVTCAASGPQALESLTRAVPDLVLLDVMMPGMDGPTTLQRMRDLPGCADLPVIFLTAKTQRADVEAVQGLGALAVLPKPFDPLTLPDELRAVIAQRTRGRP